MSKSQRASIISRALLNMEAESTVIFAPMLQLGWRRAWAGVARSISSRDQVRKGPPEAVSSRRRGRLPPVPCRHWKMALCSLSTGSSGLPARRAASMTRWPPVTRASLLARSTCRPAPRASMTLCSPAMPTTATSTMSASTSAAAAWRASGPMTQRQKRQSAGISSAGMGSTRPAISGRKVRTCSKSSSLFRRAVSARTVKRSG